MYCPKCGTKALGSDQRFCRECGAEINAGTASEQPNRQGWSAPPLPRPSMSAYGYNRGNPMRTVLIVAGVLLLAPLALHLAFGILFAGVALIFTAIKLAPLIAIGLLIYWAVTRRRHPHHSGRW